METRQTHRSARLRVRGSVFRERLSTSLFFVPVLFVLFNNFCFSTIRTVGTTYFKNAYGTEFTTPDGKPYNPDFPMMAKSFGIESARVEKPAELEDALRKALAAKGPFLLDVWTRGDVPMPRTGHWDIAEFLVLGND